MPESPRAILKQLGNDRATNQRAEGGCANERPRFRENPRAVLQRIARGYVHECVAQALATAGFPAQGIERLNYHPVWQITLARPWPPDAPQSRAFKNAVKSALRQVDPRIPVQDLEVMVKGERLILLFIWEAPTGPGLLAIQPNRTDFLRRPDGGGQWDSWEVVS
jgi:hypothetical protein